jgi:PleD family two-component response regulator
MVSASIFVKGDYPPSVCPLSGEASDSSDSQPHRPTVLLVDDEPLIVDTLTEVLEDAGFHVLPAYDGWMALEKVADCRPDYLLPTC